MTQIVVVTREGTEHTIRPSEGLSVMEAIRESGIDELLALCGGCLSCATCHVYVDPVVGTALPPMTADEDDLLDSSSFRSGLSRLACQLIVSDSLDGTRFVIAPED